MDEREEIITIIFSILGLISMIIIISLLICYCFRRHSISIARQQQYKRSQNVIRKRRKRRFTTNESSISFSFNPPHLINQKVKNLVKTEHYQKRYSTNDIDRYYANLTTEPVYTSASSRSTPISNVALALHMYPHSPQLNNLRFQFLNELNHVLCVKQERRPTNSLKYSQSCRQQNDQLPFDYYRSITPSVGSGSNQYLFESNSRRTMANATLIRKAHLAKFIDDTAILY